MVIVVMGVSGCGKTKIGGALAEALGCAFHDADDFHPPANVEKMRRGQPLNNADRRPWLDALGGVIRQAVRHRQDAVVTCSALSRWSRELLGTDHPDVCLVHLRGTYELIYSRIAAREGHFMPPELLKSQFETLEEPSNAIDVEIDAEPAAIVDRLLGQLSRSGTHPSATRRYTQ